MDINFGLMPWGCLRGLTIGTHGDTRKNFGRVAHVIFWRLKFNKLFLALLKIGAILGRLKNMHYFWGLTRNLHYFGFLKK